MGERKGWDNSPQNCGPLGAKSESGALGDPHISKENAVILPAYYKAGGPPKGGT